MKRKNPKKKAADVEGEVEVGANAGGKSIWAYTDIPTDKMGWVRDSRYKPYPYDLCHLIIKGRDKSLNGWWTGFGWDGLFIDKSDQIVAWKVNKEWI